MPNKRIDQLGQDGAFVMGPARCGSTLVSDIINLHPDILSISEFFASHALDCLLQGSLTGSDYWQRLSKSSPIVRIMITRDTMPGEFLYRSDVGRFPIGDVPPILKITLPHLSNNPDKLFDQLSDTVPNQPMQSRQAHHAMLFENLKNLCGGNIWVERSGMSLMYARILPQLFPRAKFIMMYRDGRDVSLSLQSFKPARAIIWIWSKLRKLGVNPLNLDSPMGRSKKYKLFAEFPNNQNFFISKWPAQWMLRNPPPLKDCADFWSEITIKGLAEFKKIPNSHRYYLCYENLVKDPKPQLTTLANFLNVDPQKDWLNKAVVLPQKLQPRWKNLDFEEQKKLDEWTKNARTEVDKFFANYV
tara:strand:- start:124 stop:1200 length:1077 start_codon:yes stop_codon:yes gene_type:complete